MIECGYCNKRVYPDSDGKLRHGCTSSHSPSCSIADVKAIWRMTASRAGGGRLDDYHSGYDSAMLKLRKELAKVITNRSN